MPAAPPYSNPFPIPYYPAEQSHMFPARDGRYSQAPLPYADWHSMMAHDRGEYHRDYDRRPPPTSNT